MGFPTDCTHCDLLGESDALLIAVTGPPAPEGREAGGYDIECVEVIETPGQSKPMMWALHLSFSLLVGLSPSITIHYQPVNVGASRTSEIPVTWPRGAYVGGLHMIQTELSRKWAADFSAPAALADPTIGARAQINKIKYPFSLCA